METPPVDEVKTIEEFLFSFFFLVRPLVSFTCEVRLTFNVLAIASSLINLIGIWPFKHSGVAKKAVKLGNDGNQFIDTLIARQISNYLHMRLTK